MRMKKYFFLLLSLFCLIMQGQNNHDSISSASYLSDFDLFTNYLEQTHPDPYTAFGGKIYFRKTVQEVREQIKNIQSVDEFEQILRNLLVRLEDGHTFIYASSKKKNLSVQAKFLPLTFKTATDGLFVARTTENYKKYVGYKLIAVDGITTDSLAKRMRVIAPIENKYGAWNVLENVIAHQKGAQKLLKKERVENLCLTLQNRVNNIENITVELEEKFTFTPISQEMNLNEGNGLLSYRLLPDCNAAYFRWNAIASREIFIEADSTDKETNRAINWLYGIMKRPKPKNFTETIDGLPELYGTFYRMLTEMKENKLEYLIVDLRKNGGGMTPLCMPLLYMLYGNDYLNYRSDAEYHTLISPLLLKKYKTTLEKFNQKEGKDYKMGDYVFSPFFPYKDIPLSQKQTDLSLISYENGTGKQYTINLKGRPVYRPHVIVLSSPATFSAAYHFMYFLTEIGNATVIGVPSSQAGNTYMESTRFELPYSGIAGSISNAIQIMFPNDEEKGHVFIPTYPMTINDYAKYNFVEDAEILYCLDLIKQGKILQKQQ
ncbi:S41 family peptidase [Porphyromonas macacae]|uniref:S41 family peptidase n=1 Tax=Porphyromonas macacae TaxID=28115 RepID=UPI0009DCB391|nr:S41 family peptidase [Porphyromonas macacae]